MANGFGDFAPDMNYLLSPLEQYQRYAMQQMPDRYALEGAAPLSPYARQALTQSFTPAYQYYQFEEPTGTYGTFSDYLGEAAYRAAPTRQAIRQRIGGLYAGSVDPLLMQYYMGDENAMKRQQNLAQLDLMTNRGARAAFNPALQAAARGAIENMYQDYIGGMGGSDYGTEFKDTGPTGFLRYYMGRRGGKPDSWKTAGAA